MQQYDQQMNISMVGFGEAARAFVTGWQLPSPPRAYDITPMQQAYGDAGVEGFSTLAPALREAKIIFCLVPADQALAAAEAAAPHLAAGALWIDGNSCSPGTKKRAERVIADVGGRYVDMAIMSPVKPHLHRTPVLLSGAHAGEAEDVLLQLGMRPGVAGTEVGDASSIKMLRSVMIKGMEALTAECLLAARRAGVEGAVLASLQASDPHFDWPARSAYNLERMSVHGARRAAEMREVVNTLDELGLPSRMAGATALWQDQVAAAGAGGDSLDTRLDALLGALK